MVVVLYWRKLVYEVLKRTLLLLTKAGIVAILGVTGRVSPNECKSQEGNSIVAGRVRKAAIVFG